MSPKLEETIVLRFTTTSPTTGGTVDADALPTAEVLEDATDTTVTALTVVKRGSTTGQYRVSVALLAASGFEAGKSYTVQATAIVGGVTNTTPLTQFTLRASSVDDVSSGGPVVIDAATGWGGDPLPAASTPTTVAALVDAVWDGAPAGVPLEDLATAVWDGAPAGVPLSEVAAAIWDEPQSGHATAATFGSYLDAAVSGVSGGGGGASAGAIADAVWDEARSGHTTAGTFGQGIASVTGTVNATLVATGLDAIPVTAPAGVATTFPQMTVALWRRFFKKVVKTDTQIRTFADNGSSVVTTQTISSSSGTDTQGAAS